MVFDETKTLRAAARMNERGAGLQSNSERCFRYSGGPAVERGPRRVNAGANVSISIAGAANDDVRATTTHGGGDTDAMRSVAVDEGAA